MHVYIRQSALMLVAERGAKGMSVHVTPAFEDLVMPVQTLRSYVNGTRCLPLYAVARCVSASCHMCRSVSVFVVPRPGAPGTDTTAMPLSRSIQPLSHHHQPLH